LAKALVESLRHLGLVDYTIFPCSHYTNKFNDNEIRANKLYLVPLVRLAPGYRNQFSGIQKHVPLMISSLSYAIAHCHLMLQH
jgi:hypothetical protein